MRWRRIPNVIVLPAALGALVWRFHLGEWVSGVAAAAFAGLAFILPAVLYGSESAGAGDVKLAIFLGLSLGLRHTVLALLIAGSLASAFVLAGVASGRLGRRSLIPMGPFLATGGLAVLLSVP
jgi:prepilin signal peptidase PulO-like enzyme (type II secretory pathway)